MRSFRLLALSTVPLLFLIAGCGKEGQGPGSKPASGTPEVKGTPVVTFEGGAVTLEQLQGYLSQMNPAARTRVEPLEQRREYAEGIARFELFVLEARRRGLENDPEVQEAMKRAMVQRLLFKEFDEKATPISPEEVSAYYESHKGEFVQPARARYSHLLVPAPKGSPERAAKKKHAQAVLEKARKLQPLDFDAFDALIVEASGNKDAKPTEADSHLVTPEELKARLGEEIATAASKLKQPGDLSPGGGVRQGLPPAQAHGRAAGEEPVVGGRLLHAERPHHARAQGRARGEVHRGASGARPLPHGRGGPPEAPGGSPGAAGGVLEPHARVPAQAHADPLMGSCRSVSSRSGKEWPRRTHERRADLACPFQGLHPLRKVAPSPATRCRGGAASRRTGRAVVLPLGIPGVQS